jgi:hypothetical protein
MKHIATIKLTKEQQNLAATLLREDTLVLDQDDIPLVVTAKFEDGYRAEIRCCNDEPPYVDSILFDPEGQEVLTPGRRNNIEGEYCFKDPNGGLNPPDEYIVVVEPAFAVPRRNTLTEGQQKAIHTAHANLLYALEAQPQTEADPLEEGHDWKEILLSVGLLEDNFDFLPKKFEDFSECQNCEFVAEHDSLPEAKDLSQRIAPGDPHTDRECPRCGALCYPVTQEVLV